MAKRAKKENKKGLNMTDSMKQKYAELFADALDSMEEQQWQKPWVSPHNGLPCNIYRKSKPYKSTNYFYLTLLCELKGWSTPYFITKTQMKNEDGVYKYKGLTANATLAVDDSGCAVIDENGMPVMEYEKRFPVILWKPYFKDADGNVIAPEDYDAMTDDEKKEVKRWFYQRNYLVYNIDQTNFKELYPDDYKKFTEAPEHEYKASDRDEVLERMIMMGEWRCPIQFTGQQSCFIPSMDVIRLPRRDQFLGDSEFYQTAIHEMAHSTGPELGRDVENGFGTDAYAREEFVAEISSACICSMLGIGKLLDKNHIAYVQSWRKALHDDKDFLPETLDQVKKVVNYFMRKYSDVAEHKNSPLLLEAA